ncbi:hypothetical protein DSL92_06450 [Billgrantia gudaonensis]|uniref:Uncharacterized protein n=1 Tax=Billgrantia gudaonensis TaxID=376427 RepID=A0A432JIM4_9GAMM|nr:hypothetical protein DSL92_06450 [Halomonas gudaonensis]
MHHCLPLPSPQPALARPACRALRGPGVDYRLHRGQFNLPCRNPSFLFVRFVLTLVAAAPAGRLKVDWPCGLLHLWGIGISRECWFTALSRRRVL